MQESFDKKLSNKIRSTFEHYYEPVNTLAWEKMKTKLLNKKSKRIIMFNNIAKAASVILIIGISILLPQKINTYNNSLTTLKPEYNINKQEKKSTYQDVIG